MRPWEELSTTEQVKVIARMLGEELARPWEPTEEDLARWAVEDELAEAPPRAGRPAWRDREEGGGDDAGR